MKLDIQASEAQYEENVVNFRQTLYPALGDVENALSARQAEQLYALRYRAGPVALKSWLDAQEKRRAVPGTGR